jgi:hypothetical protein
VRGVPTVIAGRLEHNQKGLEQIAKRNVAAIVGQFCADGFECPARFVEPADVF